MAEGRVPLVVATGETVGTAAGTVAEALVFEGLGELVVEECCRTTSLHPYPRSFRLQREPLAAARAGTVPLVAAGTVLLAGAGTVLLVAVGTVLLVAARTVPLAAAMGEKVA